MKQLPDFLSWVIMLSGVLFVILGIFVAGKALVITGLVGMAVSVILEYVLLIKHPVWRDKK